MDPELLAEVDGLTTLKQRRDTLWDICVRIGDEMKTDSPVLQAYIFADGQYSGMVAEWLKKVAFMAAEDARKADAEQAPACLSCGPEPHTGPHPDIPALEESGSTLGDTPPHEEHSHLWNRVAELEARLDKLEQ